MTDESTMSTRTKSARFLIGFACTVAAIGIIGFALPASWNALVYPKTVKEATSPSGKYMARVLVSPAKCWNRPAFMFYLYLVSRQSVDIKGRIIDTDSGKTLGDVELMSNEDCEDDAKTVDIEWLSDVSVRFLSTRRSYDRTAEIDPRTGSVRD